VTPQQYAFLAEYVARSSTVLAHVAERGSRYSRDWVREYQLWYNANLSQIQSIFAARAAEQGQSASQVTADIQLGLGELAVDGLWGDRTAFRTSIFSGVTAVPPEFASRVGAWWARRSAQYAAQIDEYSRLANPSPADVPAAPPAAQVPPVVSADEETPPAVVDDVGARLATKPAGENKWNWASILGVVAVLGVGGFLAYQIMGRKSGTSKAKRLRAATA